MAYSLYVAARADRELEKLPDQTQDRINAAIDALSDEPHPRGSRKLSGRKEHRLRVGDYRVLYLVDEEAESVTVTRVGHRQGIYG